MTATNGRSSQPKFLEHVSDVPAPEIPWPAPGWDEDTPSKSSASVAIEPGKILSPSQVNKFLDCPANWYFKYMVGLPDPVTSALAVGIAVDNAISHYFRVKAAERVDMPEGDVMDVLDLARAHQEAVVSLKEGEDPEKLHALCQRLVRSYLTEMAPKVQPALIDGKPAVQVEVSGKIADVKVRGIIDLVTDDGAIIDLKTKRDKPGGVPADHMLQLTTYDLLCPHSRGQAAIHYMVKGRSEKSVAKTVPYTREIGPAEVQFVENIYPATQEAMRDGLYIPRRTSRFCSRKFCPFWGACEKEFGGQVAE
jgi:hypothetical protein